MNEALYSKRTSDFAISQPFGFRLGTRCSWLIATLLLAITFGVIAPNLAAAALTHYATINGMADEPKWLVSGDVNEDELPDLVVANVHGGVVPGGTVSTLLSDGTGCFTQPAGSPTKGAQANGPLTLADFNNDGHLDLAQADEDGAGGGVNVMLGNGSGEFGTWMVIGDGYGWEHESELGHFFPRSLATGDVNGDENEDLVVGYSYGGIGVFLGDGLGGFSESPGTPEGGNGDYLSIAAEDVNGDQNLDILALNQEFPDELKVLLGDGKGGFTKAKGSPIEIGAATVSMSLLDANNDEHPDIVTLSYGKPEEGIITLWEGDGTGEFEAVEGEVAKFNGEEFAPDSPIEVGDINGDELPDLLVHTWYHSVTALLGDGASGFKEAPWSPVEGGAGEYLALADFDQNGHLDVATSHYGYKTHEIQVYLGGESLLPLGPDCLLSRYAPEIKYDSQESYHADSAAEITDNWGDGETGLWGESEEDPYSNVLWDGDGEGVPGDGDLLALSHPKFEAEFPLGLSALGTIYPNSLEADSNDWLDERNDHYVDDAQALEAHGYINREYGRMTTDKFGKRWLQYWFFYYYNSLEIAGIGEHEGDWEMIQVGLDSFGVPDEVVFSQHKGAARCGSTEFEVAEDEVPIVYSALDSHASYPLAGSYELPPIEILEESPGDDYADGEGGSVRPALEIVGDESPSWVAWPGHWGNSRGAEDSPVGPAQHGSWTDPAAYAEEAHECFSNYDGPPERERSKNSGTLMSSRGVIAHSTLLESARILRGHAHIDYGIRPERNHGWPRLILSVDSPNDGLPPMTKVFKRIPSGGEAVLPFELDPRKKWIALASVVYRNGTRSNVASRRLQVK
jgi:hypothetical protein